MRHTDNPINKGKPTQGPHSATEKIKVYICFENGETVCICKRSRKKCSRRCMPDVVERDKFRDWQDVSRQDRYGKGK